MVSGRGQLMKSEGQIVYNIDSKGFADVYIVHEGQPARCCGQASQRLICLQIIKLLNY